MLTQVITKGASFVGAAKEVVTTKALGAVSSLDLGTYINPDKCPESPSLFHQDNRACDSPKSHNNRCN